MNKLAALVILLVSSAPVTGAEQSDSYASKTHGFSIKLPADKKSEAPLYQLAVFYLPVSDGYPPNINIQRQRFAGTMLEYEQLSIRQFAKLKVEVVSKEFRKGQLVFEYQGEPQGKKMHWYSRALARDGFVYLVTAESLESQWEARKKQLMDSVDSFQLER